MNFFIKQHAKNAYKFSTKEVYIKDAEEHLGRDLRQYEEDYLLKNAMGSSGSRGEIYVWGRNLSRVVGTFSVCGTCLTDLGANNDVVKIVSAHVGSGLCDICGVRGNLRKASVDNYGKIGTMTLKISKILNRGDVVKIIDAPTRFNALIGEMGEIILVTISSNRGVTYDIELDNGYRIPYQFKPFQLDVVSGVSDDIDGSVIDYN